MALAYGIHTMLRTMGSTHAMPDVVRVVCAGRPRSLRDGKIGSCAPTQSCEPGT